MSLVSLNREITHDAQITLDSCGAATVTAGGSCLLVIGLYI